MAVGGDIAERLLRFGVAVLRLAAGFPKDRAGRHVAHQYVRSATGAGANYEKARAAESRADFVHKLAISAKEMREACYWTLLVKRSEWIQEDLGSVVQEAQELAAILGASARTARARAETAKPRK